MRKIIKKQVKFRDEFYEQLEKLCEIQGCSIDDYIQSAIITKYEFDEQIKHLQKYLEKMKQEKTSEYSDALDTGEKIFINAVMYHIESNYKFGSCGSWLMEKDKHFYNDKYSVKTDSGTKLVFEEFDLKNHIDETIKE